MRNFCRSALLFLAVATSACKEEGTIKVHSLTFNGVKAVDESRLKDALATKQSSKLPWGKKTYFDRSRFDVDLKRIQAFYSDRGYPDARVTDFDDVDSSEQGISDWLKDKYVQVAEFWKVETTLTKLL